MNLYEGQMYLGYEWVFRDGKLHVRVPPTHPLVLRRMIHSAWLWDPSDYSQHYEHKIPDCYCWACGPDTVQHAAEYRIRLLVAAEFKDEN